MVLQCTHTSFSSDTGLAHKRKMVHIMLLTEDRLQTRYMIDGAIHGWSMRKKVKSLSVDILWFQSPLSLLSMAFFHCLLEEIHGSGNTTLLMIPWRLYFNNSWQMSGMYPKLTSGWSLIKSISFRMKISLHTSPPVRWLFYVETVVYGTLFWKGVGSARPWTPPYRIECALVNLVIVSLLYVGIVK